MPEDSAQENVGGLETSTQLVKIFARLARLVHTIPSSFFFLPDLATLFCSCKTFMFWAK